METLWHICIESANEKVRDESMDLLVDLHIKIGPEVPEKEQESIWLNFIEHCMKKLDSDAEYIMINTIQILIKFLDRYEGKKPVKQDQKFMN